jgi:hypothetical protein
MYVHICTYICSNYISYLIDCVITFSRETRPWFPLTFAKSSATRWLAENATTSASQDWTEGTGLRPVLKPISKF